MRKIRGMVISDEQRETLRAAARNFGMGWTTYTREAALLLASHPDLARTLFAAVSANNVVSGSSTIDAKRRKLRKGDSLGDCDRSKSATAD